MWDAILSFPVASSLMPRPHDDIVDRNLLFATKDYSRQIQREEVAIMTRLAFVISFVAAGIISYETSEKDLCLPYRSHSTVYKA